MITHTISKFHLWLLRKIVRANIRQGWHHDKNLAQIYYTIAEECEDEFYEDNLPTQIHFQREAMWLAHHERIHAYYLNHRWTMDYPRFKEFMVESTGIEME